MVAIAPFRALRYNLEAIGGDLGRVIAPPYDVISPQLQDQLYDVSPYNIVRLIYGRQSPTDTPTDNRYTRAQQAFAQWRKTRVLVQDDLPAIYVYEHPFRWEGTQFQRLGVVAVLQFDGSTPTQVFRHEATFDAPKTDRSQLLEAVRANLSPVFCIVPDPTQTLRTMVETWSRQHQPVVVADIPPYVDGRTDSGQAGTAGGSAMRLWTITEPELVRHLVEGFASVSAFIADGHHRFEVAFANRHRFGGVMTYFAWLDDPALIVRPIHRVVRLTPEARAQHRARLEAVCTLTPVSSLEELMRWLDAERKPGRFGFYANGHLYQASLRDEALAQWLLHPSVPLSLAGLDVAILHRLVLPQLDGAIFSISSVDALLRYTPAPAEAIAMVDQGVGDCAWLLRPIPVTQVFALAAQGVTLPQKSTYFYPKVLSGLFINPFDPAPPF